MVPTLEPYVNPVWNRQDLAQRTQLRPRSEGRRHKVSDNLRIEGVPRYAYSSVTNNAVRGWSSSTNGRANVNQGEVARTASEIPNEDQFVVIKRTFVVMGRRYGLHLELYGFVAGGVEG